MLFTSLHPVGLDSAVVRCRIRSFLLSALALLLPLGLGAQVAFNGSYSENFNGMGSSGTTPPAGWSVVGALGGANNSWTTTIPASGAQSAATAGTTNTTLLVSTGGSGTSNTQGYNLGASGDTNRALGTSPTTGAGVILQLRLTNNTGSAVAGVTVAYEISRFLAVATANELPGYWLFYSTNNGTTWSNVTSLNPVLSGGTVNVPNTVGTTVVAQATINFPAPVPVGGEMRFRWVDDNAVQTSPDQIVGLDNVVIAVAQAAPVVNITTPTNGASFALPTVIALVADASDSNGSVTNVEFFANGVKLGEDATQPYEFAWSNAISGSYVLTARATDNNGATTTSTNVTVTVTNPNNVPPTVALTAPVNGATILTSNATLAATVGDTDGVIAKVEFYSGAAKLGEDTNSPFTFNWTGVTNGSYTLTAVATDNDGAAVTSAPVAVTFATPISTVLIPRRVSGQPGAVWKYLDNGTDQGTAWKEPAFDDSTWTNGAAPLGYGDSHIVTTVFSPAAPNRYITTYFRRTFSVTGAAAVQTLNLNVLRDDGVVVYINGTEVARQNMPAGTINHLTFSSSIVDGANETTYFPSTATPFPPLNEGTNIIAVELHQRDGNSSDLGFDLELIALALPGDPPQVTLTAPTNGATFTAPAAIPLEATASDPDGTVAKVEFFSGPIKIGEATNAPFTNLWLNVPQGSYSVSARVTDNVGLTATSLVASITVASPPTVPPTVAITSPTNDSTFLFPAPITIEVAASDPDGNVARVEFFSGSTKLGESTNAPYTFTWTNAPVGTFSLTARAIDNLTASNTSAAVSVQVLTNLAPAITLLAPTNGATNLGAGGVVALEAVATDPEAQPMAVTFYGRLKTAPGSNFALVTLPDTQFYSENLNGRAQYFTNQTQWIVSSRTNLNTAFVAHMGDMTQNYDAIEAEFQRASGAMAVIENPLTTLLTHGIPWGGAPGNHDIGSGGQTLYWNQYFGTNRWAGRSYWGGNFSTNNDQNYQLFSAGGVDFVVVNLAYNSSPSGNAAVLAWADSVLKAFPNRRAIITSHWLIGTGNPAGWGGHGQAVYDTLKTNANLFLMLCGHIHGEGRRQDTFNGRTVHTILQDYQSRNDGGESWLRYFIISPQSNSLTAFTYRTTTGTFENDADSSFTLTNLNLGSASGPWIPLGTVNLASGQTNASLPWSGLAPFTEYEWYAAVSDGVSAIGSAVGGFATGDTNAATTVSITASDDSAGEFGADQSVAFLVARQGPTNSALLVPLFAAGTATVDVDFSGFLTNFTIPAGASNAQLALTVLADNLAEGPETIMVNLGQSALFAPGSPTGAVATIADRPAQAYFFGAITNVLRRGPNDDADDDSLRNLLEYFMGSQPAAGASAGAVEVAVGPGDTFLVRYPRAKNRPDVTGQLQWSTNLEQWFNGGQSDGSRSVTFSEAVLPPPSADPEIVETTGTVTGSSVSRIFVRLVVQ